MLTKVSIAGRPMLPLWRKSGQIGFKCELTKGTTKRCIVCTPHGKGAT